MTIYIGGNTAAVFGTDSAILAQDVKSHARVATTANGTLATAFANGQTVDGVVIATGERILLKDQSTGAENGLHTVNASGAPTRAPDWETGDTAAGFRCIVTEGTANADIGFLVTNNDGSDVVGTDALVFAQYTTSGGAAMAHAMGGASHTGDTLANVNSKITDATLDDSSAERDPTAHAAEHTDGTDDIQSATAAQKGVATAAQITKLDGIATGADVTGSNAPQAHATSHTDGSDDIQSATAAQKGVATAAQITKLDGIEALADVTDATNVAAAGGILSGDTAGGDLNGTYPNPLVDDGADSTAIHDNVAAEISVVTEKVTPVNADLVIIEDSADSNNKKRAQVGNLPSEYNDGGEAGGGNRTLGNTDSNNLSFITDNVERIRIKKTGETSFMGVAELANATTIIDGGITFDQTNEDISIGDGTASQVVHMGAWKTWTPVYTGFSADPGSVVARFTVVGKLVTARIEATDGTSNATGFTITLPVAASSTGLQHFHVRPTDNSAIPTAPGLLITRVGSTTADVFLDQDSTAWTASGAKNAQFTISYETN